MRRYFILLVLVAGILFTAKAQKPDTLTHKSKTDSLYKQQDTDPGKKFVPKAKKERVYHPDSNHLVHIAWTRSAFVPGWGQVYNHQWWKVPAIYAGLGCLAYYVVVSEQDYKDYLAVARYQQLGRPYTDAIYDSDPRRQMYHDLGDKYPKQSIIDAKDAAYRNRDVSILGFLAVWGVNVIDAYIYGKFQQSYSMDNNFSIRFDAGTINQPMYASNFNTTFTPVLKITITLK